MDTATKYHGLHDGDAGVYLDVVCIYEAIS